MLQHEKRRCLAAFGILGAGLLLLLLLNLRIGSVRVPMDQLWEILRGENRDSTAGQIIWTIRMPRLIAAAVLGGALAVAGFLLQTFFSNPIAGPFVLGISSGASLGAVLAMLLGVSLPVLGRLSVSAGAFAGALVSILLVYLLARTRNAVTPIRLILVGVAVSAMFQAFANYIV